MSLWSFCLFKSNLGKKKIRITQIETYKMTMEKLTNVFTIVGALKQLWMEMVLFSRDMISFNHRDLTV